MTKDSLSQKVYNELLRKILNNLLPTGEIINRRDIAAELGISVAPVLEAMLMLEKDGLLETMPGKGTRVSLIRDSDIIDHLYLREAIECFIARQICGETIIKASAELLELATQTDNAIQNPILYAKMDAAFHTELVALSGNKAVINEYEKILRVGHFYFINRFIPIIEANEHSSHQMLVEQLKVGEPEKAYLYMHEHLMSGKGYLSIARK